MRLHEEIHYPVGAAAAFGVLSDPEFLAAASRRLRALEHSAEVTEAEGVVTVTVHRVLSTAGYPPFVARVVGERMSSTQVDVWQPPAEDGSRHGSVTLRLTGAPVSLSGAAALAAAGTAASVHVLDGDLVARVPLLGRRVEEAAAPGLRSALREQGALVAQWAAQQRS